MRIRASARRGRRRFAEVTRARAARRQDIYGLGFRGYAVSEGRSIQIVPNAGGIRLQGRAGYGTLRVALTPSISSLFRTCPGVAIGGKPVIAGFFAHSNPKTPQKQAFQGISLFTSRPLFLILENDRPTETILQETCL